MKCVLCNHQPATYEDRYCDSCYLHLVTRQLSDEYVPEQVDYEFLDTQSKILNIIKRSLI